MNRRGACISMPLWCCGLIWLGCRGAANEPAARVAAARAGTPIYAFDGRADELLRAFFPDKVRVTGYTMAYQQRRNKPRFENLDAVFEHHSQAMDLVELRPKEIGRNEKVGWAQINDDVLESAWVGSSRNADWHQPLLQRGSQVAALSAGLATPARPFAGPLEKVLFQRDLLQMCMIFQEATAAAKDLKTRAAAEQTLVSLVNLWRRQWLTESEYQQLTRLRPKQLPRNRFAAANRFDLAQDYLPTRIVGDEPGWYAMPYGDQESLHFRAFAGRSFISMFIKPPGWTQDQFHHYWDAVADKFGAKVVRDGRVPPLPAGTETLLLRTFGVFLEDGTCADSGFPEEVLLRLIKYGDTELDMATSDYRGTVFYRYEMRRRALLADVGSLGLRRVLDDEPQFFGFFSEVPDDRRSYAANLTTMRNNCVSCHSEAFYGASTVFSLGHKRRGRPGHAKMEGGLLEPAGVPGRFHLRSPEYNALRRLLDDR